MRSEQAFISLKIRCFILLSLILAGFQTQLSAQTWTTTQPGDWESPIWECSQGPCNTQWPDNNVNGATIQILHDVTYSSNSPINLGNRAILEVSGATFTNLSNLNVNSSSALFRTFNALVNIGPGVMNVDGVVELTNSVVIKDGNVVNNLDINVSNACFTLES